MTTSSFPLERHLSLVQGNGARTEITIQIGQPYWIQRDIEAACPVAIKGLLDDIEDIRGIDFVDAVSLAIKFVDVTLAGMRDSRRFLWPDGEDYFDT